jgi:DNA-directed RNA polymerase specialized sigma24 family protein
MADSASPSFQTTRWSLLLRIQGNAGTRGTEAALAQWCSAYWFPLYAFLRRQTSNPQDAEDLTQGFFQHLLRSDLLQRAHPERGRLRSFLLGCLQHFQINQWRKTRAQRRGGESPTLALDALQAEERYRIESEHLACVNPETAFDRQWAHSVLEQAMTQLQSEHPLPADRKRLDLLLPALRLSEADSVDRSRLLEQTGLSEGALKVALHRLRKRYGQILRQIVADTVADPSDAEAELAHLFQCLRG